VLLINSPGGSPVQAGIINDEIERLKAIHNKPYAVVEESCASAAYYIAAAADEILSTRPASSAASAC
jgi:protease-4